MPGLIGSKQEDERSQKDDARGTEIPIAMSREGKAALKTGDFTPTSPQNLRR
jgi:hypothetical protein